MASRRGRDRSIPGWIRIPLFLGVAGWLVWRELRTPARRSVESKPVRSARNLAVAALSALTVQTLEMPVINKLTRWVLRGGGILSWLRFPLWAEVLLAVLALDYTMYLYHILAHRQPGLWRFHVAHHVDRDLDASTALRFHFGEIALSVLYRSAQVAVIGVSPLSLSVWQTAFMLSILFHHSNVRLSPEAEQILGKFIVTPHMHAIHHSNVRDEADSNWSSGLSCWDRLHGTLRLDVPQEEITIGVPAFDESEDVTLQRVLGLPFVEQPPSWQRPDGTRLLTRGA